MRMFFQVVTSNGTQIGTVNGCGPRGFSDSRLHLKILLVASLLQNLPFLEGWAIPVVCGCPIGLDPTRPSVPRVLAKSKDCANQIGGSAEKRTNRCCMGFVAT